MSVCHRVSPQAGESDRPHLNPHGSSAAVCPGSVVQPLWALLPNSQDPVKAQGPMPPGPPVSSAWPVDPISWRFVGPGSAQQPLQLLPRALSTPVPTHIDSSAAMSGFGPCCRKPQSRELPFQGRLSGALACLLSSYIAPCWDMGRRVGRASLETLPEGFSAWKVRFREGTCPQARQQS